MHFFNEEIMIEEDLGDMERIEQEMVALEVLQSLAASKFGSFKLDASE